MANPKSKIPIVRPRSEDTLLQKSKNNDNDITSIRPRAKSGNDKKIQSDKIETKISDNTKLGNITAAQNVRKDLNVDKRNNNEIKNNVILKSKAGYEGTSYVVRIDRVGDKDVLVAEEIGHGWTESAENDNEETLGVLEEYNDEVLNNSTASDKSFLNGKLDTSLNDSSENFKQSDSSLGPKRISTVLLGRNDKQITQLSRTPSNTKENYVSNDIPNSNNSKQRIDELTRANVRKLDQYRSTKIKQTHLVKPNEERPKTSRTWTPSSNNTQAFYLGSFKPDKSSNEIDQPKSDTFQVNEQIHSDVGHDTAANRIVSEITFVKDDSNKRVERIKSSESIISHFSERRRGNTFRISSSTSRLRRSKSAGATSEKVIDRFEEIELENTKSMNAGVLDNQEINDFKENFQTRITKLSKRRIPVRKKLPLDYVNSSEIPSTSSSKKTEKNRVLETLNHRNAFENKSTSSRVNSAEFINHDLKLVKRKMKDNIMVELNKTNGKSTLKKNLLSNFNKHKIKRLKNPVNEMFLRTQKHTAVVTLGRASPYSQGNETIVSSSYIESKHYPPRVNDKRSGNLKVKRRGAVKNAYTQTTWNIHVHPKIHRHTRKSASQRRKRQEIAYPSSHESVQTWLMNSSRKSKDQTNSDRYFDENHHPRHRYMNVHNRLTNAQLPNNDKRRFSKFSDNVKKGEYLPLRRLSKQSEKRQGQRRKHVEQQKGYEVG